MRMPAIPARPATLSGCRKVNEMLGRMGDKWTVFVITELLSGPLRFNEIKRRVGTISQQMLARTLKALERDGMVSRTVFPTVPVQVEYDLTPMGRSLAEPLVVLNLWVLGHMGDIEASRAAYDRQTSVER